MPLMALAEFNGLDDAPRLAQTILGLMPDTAVIVLDRDLRIVLMEGDVYARHGYEVGPLLGRDVREVIPAPAWSALREHWSAAIAGQPRTLDWASADERRDYWLHFAPLRTKAGELVGAISVAQDITERVRARERVEHRLTQQAAVSALGSLALRNIPFDELLEQAARTLHEGLGADLVLVLEHREDGGVCGARRAPASRRRRRRRSRVQASPFGRAAARRGADVAERRSAGRHPSGRDDPRGRGDAQPRRRTGRVGWRGVRIAGGVQPPPIRVRRRRRGVRRIDRRTW